MNATLTAQPILRPFQRADIECILNRDGPQVPNQVLLAQALAGPSFTAILDGRPLGCAGVLFPWPGVGMAWMVVSEEMGEHGFWLCRTVRAFLDEIIRVQALHRLEAVALVDSPRNQSWLEGLGFHVEQDGTARGFFSDGRSVKRYEWVKES